MGEGAMSCIHLTVFLLTIGELASVILHPSRGNLQDMYFLLRMSTISRVLESYYVPWTIGIMRWNKLFGTRKVI